MNHTLLIVGAGCGGTELAFAARAAGWSGPVTIVGAEAAAPYHRPPLSKAYLSGETSEASLQIKAPAVYDKFNIGLITGTAAAAIDRPNRRLLLDDGRALPYDRLALATGGRPRPLPAAAGGAESCENFHYLRTKSDAAAIRAGFGPGKRLVVIGGGYVGLEVAAAARKAGMQVTLLEVAPRLLARVTAPRLSQFYLDTHRRAGVNVRVDAHVDELELTADRRRVAAVHCAGGPPIAADLVVAGVGLVPNTELASAAGLAVDNGIVVDHELRTADPHIAAIGDCGNHHSALYDRRVRIESVPNALEQARKLAALLCGKTPRPDAAPWFWSDQYDLNLKMVGLAQGHERVVLRGDPDQGGFSAFYLLGNRVLAADTVNRPQEFALAKRIVNERIAVDDALLADDTLPLEGLMAATAPVPE
ncbi:NAD(P)/FAD-dependent oxidoreductase [Pseudoduganella namucuonensis]|uniref:3-phenylpropionate/trans-cinnamate dioxygenase ferredoxin reductase subunit n=1 Tax=Pseudoduganella namucuonensis TaxID=1035707 RepID=A0A1I7KYV7_9BURK|nr:FAD-dependent oxidoreductase [Pseudoduganella namucuonensis]SFV02578.1 3-phenylpropionate/trans-cinnamate dioxygenase ferredoxin reductase subunit [Pseudoduganella namucuonensis]